MGVSLAVLNPQDCLKKPFHPKPLISPPSNAKSFRPNRKHRRSHASSGSLSPTVDRSPSPLVNGSVKILKRGEKLPDLTSASALIDPLPAEIPMPIPAMAFHGCYAGSSVCVVSPPPSSLPVPAFAKKLDPSANTEATSALVKILGLEF